MSRPPTGFRPNLPGIAMHLEMPRDLPRAPQRTRCGRVDARVLTNVPSEVTCNSCLRGMGADRRRAKEAVAHPDAKFALPTAEFAIRDALIVECGRLVVADSIDPLVQVVLQAVQLPATAWAFEEIARQARPKPRGGRKPTTVR